MSKENLSFQTTTTQKYIYLLTYKISNVKLQRYSFVVLKLLTNSIK